MNAGTPKTGEWRGVVVVRHFVTLSLCATKAMHWSSAVRERSQTLVLFYGHAAAKPDVFAGRSP
ncbi:hypothetical protein DI339_09830 [Salmonella enterica subsp. enterica serovar Menston]|nr:hypothetical protein [Salmonella enterica subsp. enterica serovar Menston]